MTDFYQIRVEGRLDNVWSDWFEGLTITSEANDETLLSGPVVDQAALHGLLKKVRDLGLPLISVERTESISQGVQSQNRDKDCKPEKRG